MEYLVEIGSEVTSDPVRKDPHIYVRTTDTLKKKWFAEIVRYNKKQNKAKNKMQKNPNPQDKDKLKQDHTIKNLSRTICNIKKQ